MSTDAICQEYLKHLKFNGSTSSIPEPKEAFTQVELPIEGTGLSVTIQTNSPDCLNKMRLLYPQLKSVKTITAPNIILSDKFVPGQALLGGGNILLASWNGDLGCFIVALRRYLRYMLPPRYLLWHAASVLMNPLRQNGVVISGLAGVGKSTFLQRIMDQPHQSVLISNEDWFVMDLNNCKALPNGEVNLRVKQANLTPVLMYMAIQTDLPSAVGPMAILPKDVLGVDTGDDSLTMRYLLLLSLDVPPNAIFPLEPAEALARLKGPAQTAFGDTYFNDECYSPRISDLAYETSKYESACRMLPAFLINPRSSDYFVNQLTLILGAS